MSLMGDSLDYLSHKGTVGAHRLSAGEKLSGSDFGCVTSVGSSPNGCQVPHVLNEADWVR